LTTLSAWIDLEKDEDYFHVTRKTPMSEKRTLDEIRTLEIPPKGIILLTESGYLLLVKSFTDDLAWSVQRQLVNGYFKAIGKNNINIGPETLLPSEQQTLSEIVHKRAEGYGELQGKVLAEIWSRLHHKFRIAKYSQLPRTQLAEAILYVTSMEIQAGAYQAAEEYITTKQRHELNKAIRHTLAGTHYKCGEGSEQWVYNRLRVRLNLRNIDDMHPHQLADALAEVKQLEQDLSGYFSFRYAQREFVCWQIIGAGTPWTPTLVKNWKAQLKQTDGTASPRLADDEKEAVRRE
jgi:hypothetical protein